MGSQTNVSGLSLIRCLALSEQLLTDVATQGVALGFVVWLLRSGKTNERNIKSYALGAKPFHLLREVFTCIDGRLDDVSDPSNCGKSEDGSRAGGRLSGYVSLRRMS